MKPHLLQIIEIEGIDAPPSCMLLRSSCIKVLKYPSAMTKCVFPHIGHFAPEEPNLLSNSCMILCLSSLLIICAIPRQIHYYCK